MHTRVLLRPRLSLSVCCLIEICYRAATDLPWVVSCYNALQFINLHLLVPT